jgi:protein-disulfide isomerase
MSKQKNQRKSKAQQKTSISPLMIVGVAVAATLLVVGLIVLGNQSAQSSSEPVDLSQFPTLGDPDAPVTLLEYSDYG